MTAKAEIHYVEVTGYWSWSVNYCGKTRCASVTGYELTYEDALERVQYWLEELVDGTEVES